MKQRETLEQLLKEIDVEYNENVLAELIYTASETGLIENISMLNALIVAKLVIMSNRGGSALVAKIRM